MDSRRAERPLADIFVSRDWSRVPHPESRETFVHPMNFRRAFLRVGASTRGLRANYDASISTSSSSGESEWSRNGC
jgi:hypothetical protein